MQSVGLHFNGTDTRCEIPVSLTSAGAWRLTLVIATDQNDTTDSKIYRQACLFGYDSPEYKSRDFHVDIKQGNLFIFSGLAGSNDASQLQSGTLQTDHSDFGWDTGKLIADGKPHSVEVAYRDGEVLVFLDSEYLGFLNVLTTINSNLLYLGASLPGESVYSRFDLYDFELEVDGELSVSYQPNASSIQTSTLIDNSGNGHDGSLIGSFSTTETTLTIVDTDTQRLLLYGGYLDADIERKLQTAVTVDFDTQRRLKISVVGYHDMERVIQYSAEVTVDVQRVVLESVEFNCDIWRQLPHKVNENSASLQSVTIGLQEQQLTDSLSFVMAGDIDIMDAVTFQAWDYILYCRAEETSKKGVLLSCKCTVDIDEILYQKMAYKIPESAFEWTAEYNEAYAKYNYLHPTEPAEKMPSAPASAHITSIAGCIGKNVSIQFSDWISTMSTEVKSGTNYAGLIEELFGWTSRLPHLMINCYIRGNTLYAVQRGHENNVVTLDGQKLSLHTINKKIMRMTWGSDPDSHTDVEPIYNSWVSEDLTPFPKQEEEGGGEGTSTIGQNHLVRETEVNHGSERVVTQYKYQDMGGGQQFLYEEIQNTYVGGELIDHIVTTHKPVSFGQAQVYATDDDGVLGSVVSPSNFDERITPYQSNQAMYGGGYSEAFVDGAHDDNGNYYPAVYDGQGNRYLVTGHTFHKEQTGQRTRLNAYALVDTSFPVDGYDKLQYLTNQIEWLDRKTEESVTLDIYDYPHLIDFNDKIIWQGNTYYLRSNTAVKTETLVNKQTIEFVRWY